MKNLDKTWRNLMILGILFLFAYIIFTVFESLSGANSAFNKRINKFQSNVLISDRTKAHIEEFSEFQNSN